MSSTIIGAYEAKTKLPEIMRKAEQGQRFTITNRGKAVVDIVSSQMHDEKVISEAIANITNTSVSQIPDSIYKKLLDSVRQ